MRAGIRSMLIGLGLSACLLAGPGAFAASVSGPVGSTVPHLGGRGLRVRVLPGYRAQLGNYSRTVTGSFGSGTTPLAFRGRRRTRGVSLSGGAGLRGTVSTRRLPTTGGSSGSASFVQGTGSPSISGGLQVGGTIDGLRIVRVIHLTATAYGPTAQDNYPYGATDAFGKPLRPGDVAVDPRVIKLNTKMYVTGYRTAYLPSGGELAVARDTGGAIKGNRIDMYLNTHNESLINSFGIQHVTAYILG